MTSSNERAAIALNGPLFGQRTLHIFTLCGFAFTQPILVALLRQSVYLHDQHVGWIEVGVLLLILMLLIPLVFVGIDRVVLRASQAFRGRGRNIVLVVLCGVVLLSLMRPLASLSFLELSGFAGLLLFAVVIPSSWVLVLLYERAKWFRSWLTFASIGLLLFPGSFLWQFRSIRSVEVAIEEGIPVKNPIPVVVVVFDEFCGTTLLNDQMEIDADRFPQFARLASLSTFYRNATTVHPRTQVAVPAILSGRFPKTDLSPLESQYPGNLLQVIEATKKFEMAVFEAATRLCPISVRRLPEPPRSTPQKCIAFVHTLSTVYPRLILSRDIPAWLPKIPNSWFGMPEQVRDDPPNLSDATEGIFNYFSTANRKQQFEHFLNCVRASDRPRFVFYHTVFPHYPWGFLPTGQQYEMESAAPAFPAGASGELGEDWRHDPTFIIQNEFRYRLQLGYIDHLIGQLLDRLEETGIKDRCLLIVTADHGVSFRAGHSRRLPDAENLPDIVSVPLFIKLPNQTEGRVDDRNVESVDILPTIAEVLEINLPQPVDGIPVSQEKRSPRKTLYFESAMTVIEPDLPQRRSAVRRQSEIFGSGELDQPPSGLFTHQEWHGRTVDSFRIDPQSIPYFRIDPHKFNYIEGRPDKSMLVNRLVTGRIESSLLPQTTVDLVVALDGVIVDSGKTCPFESGNAMFEFLLPKTAMATGDGEIEIYLVGQADGQPHLRRLKNDPSLSRVFQPD